MMTRLFASVAVVASLLSGAAIAQTNPGLDQLSLIEGVAPGTLSANQLSDLRDARRDNDHARVDFILSQASVASRGDAGFAAGNAGVDQLAAIAGVEAGRFSANELNRLIDAQRANDDETVSYILSGASAEVRGGVGEVSPGKAQLAAVLGLNAADYTLAELTAISAARTSSY